MGLPGVELAPLSDPYKQTAALKPSDPAPNHTALKAAHCVLITLGTILVVAGLLAIPIGPLVLSHTLPHLSKGKMFGLDLLIIAGGIGVGLALGGLSGVIKEKIESEQIKHLKRHF